MCAQGMCDDIIHKNKYCKNTNTHSLETGYKHCNGYHTAETYAVIKITGRIHLI